MGILPNSQFGDIAVVDVTGTSGNSDVRFGTSGIPVLFRKDLHFLLHLLSLLQL